jgi:hypothetical protein
MKDICAPVAHVAPTNQPINGPINAAYNKPHIHLWSSKKDVHVLTCVTYVSNNNRYRTGAFRAAVL